MKQYSEYKETGIEWIGKIPQNWKIKKFKYLLKDIIGGGTPETSNPSYWEENGTPWVTIADISASNGTLKDTEKKVSSLGIESKKLKLIPRGTLLISMFI